jgi:hypothetical protein
MDNYKAVLATMVPRIGRLPLIEVEYALALRTAEREWVEQIVKDLRSGKLSWSLGLMKKYAARLFDSCSFETSNIPKKTRQKQL